MRSESDRIIVDHGGTEKGPLVIVFGAMHGNEPAGVQALEMMKKMLEAEPIANPAFEFKGNLLGLIGNLKAYHCNQRYIHYDLNRQWTEEKISRIYHKKDLDEEEQELMDIIQIIDAKIKAYKPESLVVLDLHTTSSDGGIFTICTDDDDSIKMGMDLHAPVVKGMLCGLEGTTLHYFNTKNMQVPTIGITFESGQHDDPLSVHRAIAGIINCLRTAGCVSAHHIENRHDNLLIEYSRALPNVTKLVQRKAISPEDQFRMLPNYKNFQKVTKGEVIARDIKGDIVVDKDARILMPLYQTQGEDGFFLVQEIEGY